MVDDHVRPKWVPIADPRKVLFCNLVLETVLYQITGNNRRDFIVNVLEF